MAAKLPQECAANALGVTRQAVSKWEVGASCPTAAQLAELATMYCACAHTLLFGEPFHEVRVKDLLFGQHVVPMNHKEGKGGRKRVA